MLKFLFKNIYIHNRKITTGVKLKNRLFGINSINLFFEIIKCD